MTSIGKTRISIRHCVLALSTILMMLSVDVRAEETHGVAVTALKLLEDGTAKITLRIKPASPGYELDKTPTLVTKLGGRFSVTQGFEIKPGEVFLVEINGVVQRKLNSEGVDSLEYKIDGTDTKGGVYSASGSRPLGLLGQ